MDAVVGRLRRLVRAAEHDDPAIGVGLGQGPHRRGHILVPEVIADHEQIAGRRRGLGRLSLGMGVVGQVQRKQAAQAEHVRADAETPLDLRQAQVADAGDQVRVLGDEVPHAVQARAVELGAVQRNGVQHGDAEGRGLHRQPLVDAPVVGLSHPEDGGVGLRPMRVAPGRPEARIAVKVVGIARAQHMQREAVAPPLDGAGQQLRPRLGGAVVGRDEAREIQRDIDAPIGVGDERAEQTLRLLLGRAEIDLGKPGVFRIARQQLAAVLRFEALDLGLVLERSVALVPDEGMVGQDGAIAAAAGPHDEVVLLVVAATVNLVEAAEFSHHGPADPDAEPHRRRHIADRRQIVGQARPGGAGFGRRQIAEAVLVGERGQGRIVGTRVHEPDHRVQPRHPRHLRQGPRGDHRIGIEQQQVHPPRRGLAERPVAGAHEAQVLGIAHHPQREGVRNLRHQLVQGLGQAQVVGRVVDQQDLAADPADIVGAMQQGAHHLPRQVRATVQRRRDQDGPRYARLGETLMDRRRCLVAGHRWDNLDRDIRPVDQVVHGELVRGKPSSPGSIGVPWLRSWRLWRDR